MQHTTLYVGNLPSHQDPRDIERLMTRYGTFVHTTVLVEPDMLRRCGTFAVVQMQTEPQAQAALAALNGLHFHGSILDVRYASAGEQSAAGHPPMFEPMNM